MAQLATAAPERRDFAARVARDRLALMFGLHPKQVARLDLGLVLTMTTHLNEVNRKVKSLVDSTAMDELTQVLRRPAGLEALQREISRARRGGEPALIVCFIDVDDLKRINDRSGHPAGDELLREIGRTLRASLRAYDVVMRWGGDEFICVLPESGMEGALRILDEIAADFAKRTGCTFSAGFAELDEDDDPDRLIARADEDLYAGRTHRHPDPPDAARRRTRVRIAVAASAASAALMALGVTGAIALAALAGGVHRLANAVWSGLTGGAH